MADLGVPMIHFGVGTAHLLPLMSEAGATVVGADWRTPLADARRLGKPVQGNLDPTCLFAPLDVVERKVHQVLEDAGDQPGHVFNLGWGVLPDTDPDVLTRVVEVVHAG
jgi:uroporphyrinogen decarboxylase